MCRETGGLGADLMSRYLQERHPDGIRLIHVGDLVRGSDRDGVLALLRGRDRAVIHDLAANPPHSYAMSAIRRLAGHRAFLNSYYPSRRLLLGHDADWGAMAGWVWVLQDDS